MRPVWMADYGEWFSPRIKGNPAIFPRGVVFFLVY